MLIVHLILGVCAKDVGEDVGTGEVVACDGGAVEALAEHFVAGADVGWVEGCVEDFGLGLWVEIRKRVSLDF